MKQKMLFLLNFGNVLWVAFSTPLIITREIGRYCYVINYAPETGQPCCQLQIRNVQGYNEQVVGFDSV
jgi:hypothetical protein